MSGLLQHVICTGLRVVWPDGTIALDGLDVAFTERRTGLTGGNGEGKTTLLRVVAGEVTPTAGTSTTAGSVAYLPQSLPLRADRTVADLLGISDRLRALRAIEAGDADPRHFAAVGEDWDVEARALETLNRFAVLPADPTVLDRALSTLSGGEAVLSGVVGMLLRGADVTLLDEPSNNLDARARGILLEAMDAWPGVLVVATHDRELLEHVDGIVELRDGAAQSFGGRYSAYQAALAAEQLAAQRDVRAAQGHVAREQRQLIETQTKLAHRRRFADKAFREKREPKIKMNEMKRQAQVSAAKYRDVQADRVGRARQALAAAEAKVRADDVIRVALPGTEVPDGRDVLRVGNLAIRGPERVALTGLNGSGKTTLLDAVAGRRRHPAGPIGPPTVPTAYLPQRLDALDDAATVLDNIRTAAPSATPHDIRAGLARFLIRGDRVDLPASALSGGERFRVTLAALLLAEPPPQLLLLDEPTNNLDLTSVGQLVLALQAYRGALLVVSHDERFLREVGVARRWTVHAVGLPVET